MDYWYGCERLIARLPAHARASYEGPVPNKEVGEIIAGHDLFFVPTQGENFGHVFLEALSAGVPVLTSDQAPWRDLQGDGVGWHLPLWKVWAALWWSMTR
jgi:glycosyltransferase involved in cell wall biosynthesis